MSIVLKVKNIGCVNSGDTRGHFVDKKPQNNVLKQLEILVHNRAMAVCFWFWQLGVLVHYCCPLLCKCILKNCITSLNNGENSGLKSMVSLEFIIVSHHYNTALCVEPLILECFHSMTSGDLLVPPLLAPN